MQTACFVGNVLEGNGCRSGYAGDDDEEKGFHRVVGELTAVVEVVRVL